jgi:hypothetical protein
MPKHVGIRPLTPTWQYVAAFLCQAIYIGLFAITANILIYGPKPYLSWHFWSVEATIGAMIFSMGIYIMALINWNYQFGMYSAFFACGLWAVTAMFALVGTIFFTITRVSCGTNVICDALIEWGEASAAGDYVVRPTFTMVWILFMVGMVVSAAFAILSAFLAVNIKNGSSSERLQMLMRASQPHGNDDIDVQGEGRVSCKRSSRYGGH